MKFQSKILCAFLLVALLTLSTVSSLAYYFSSQAIEQSRYDMLSAVRELKKESIENYFHKIITQIETFSENGTVIRAMEDFKSSFHTLAEDLEKEGEKLSSWDENIKKYYHEEFIPRLEKNSGQKENLELFFPKNKNVKALQYLYMTHNSYPVGEKHQLNWASQEVPYNKHHKKYHPSIRNFLEKNGYYDIFLVDNETGNLVYTVFKEVDVGTSLLTGPYANTNFARAFKAVRHAKRPQTIHLEDFEFYPPSYLAPASFIASPIFKDGKSIGTLIFQMPLDRINGVMTGNQGWQEQGLGKTGESYIVGSDHLMRTNSRFLIEDSENYLEILKNNDVQPNVIQKMKDLDTSILIQRVMSSAESAAIQGKTGQEATTSYTGKYVLSSYTPLNILNLNWAILAEISQEEAFAQIYDLRNYFIACALLIFLLLLISIPLFAKQLIKPLESATKTIANISQELGDSSTTFNTISQEIRKEMGSLSQRAEETSGHNASVNKSMRQLVQKIQQSNHAIQNATKLSTGIFETASTSSKEFKAMHKSTQEVSNTVKETMTTIHNLDKVNKEVLGVLGAVHKIADNIKLLSLNASIEAAKAGELGRTFTVVAHSIKELAEGVLAYYVEVKSKSDVIGKTTTEAVNAMESIVSQVDKLNTNVEDFQKYIEMQQESSEHISKEMQIVSTGMIQMSSSVQNTSDMSTQISQSVTDFQSSSSQVLDVSGSLISSANTATEMGTRLKKVIGNLKLLMGEKN